MKRNIFTLLMVFVLALGATALMAQAPTTQPLPPSQQVDQSGQPETGTGVDVDVDAGDNAKNGVLDVDVDRHTDADTAAEPGDTAATTTTTGGTYDNATDTSVSSDSQSLPNTASDMPLLGLLGLLSLAGAFAVRFNR